jgi:hypothetical protein
MVRKKRRGKKKNLIKKHAFFPLPSRFRFSNAVGVVFIARACFFLDGVGGGVWRIFECEERGVCAYV